MSIKFLFPIDGDCLTANDGEITNGALFVSVEVKAESGRRIEINGITADEKDGLYSAKAAINGKTVICAKDAENGENTEITVYNFEKMRGGYRISSDDNLRFLQDITVNKDVYKSIFENPYLAVYKKAHDMYGANIHINLFYESDEETGFKPVPEYFNLSMVTDKFKDEWRENADWLELSFHSKREFPCNPYINSGYEEVANDCKKAQKEIMRFTGIPLSDITTLHYGSATEEGVKALRDNGYRALAGYFEFDEHGAPLVAYFYSPEMIEHVGARDFWYDKKLDVLYSRIDRVMNLNPTPEVNLDVIEQVLKVPGRSAYVEVMIHEQYFYKDYFCHIPQFEKIVLSCAKLLYDKGYRAKGLDKALELI